MDTGGLIQRATVEVEYVSRYQTEQVIIFTFKVIPRDRTNDCKGNIVTRLASYIAVSLLLLGILILILLLMIL